eukprot:2112761-Pyramimonas_sp.AAC.1
MERIPSQSHHDITLALQAASVFFVEGGGSRIPSSQRARDSRRWRPRRPLSLLGFPAFSSSSSFVAG